MPEHDIPDSTETTPIIRRPIQARNTRWAQAIARWMASMGIKPNWISLASVFFATISGGSVLLSSTCSTAGRAAFYVLAAVCIQARLLCNLFDGMVAVEGGLKTKSGEVFNDLPDRIADPLIIIPVGYVIPPFPMGPELGWLAGLLCVFTAYVRVLGGAAGLAQRFTGPMAKQHRMAIMTFALVIAASVTAWDYQNMIFMIALGVIILGCGITAYLRIYAIIHDLERK
jgi:phosphatidylglycerophosphate synthase